MRDHDEQTDIIDLGAASVETQGSILGVGDLDQTLQPKVGISAE